MYRLPLHRSAQAVTTAPVDGHTMCAGWAAWDGTATPATLSNSFNVSSLTDNGLGDHTVNWLSEMGASTYAIAGFVKGVTASSTFTGGMEVTSLTAAAARVNTASDQINTRNTDAPNCSLIAYAAHAPTIPSSQRSGLALHEGLAGYYVYGTYAAGVPTIGTAFNVSSLTDNAAGDMTINFAKNLTSAEYFVSNMTAFIGTASVYQQFSVSQATAPTNAAVRLLTTDYFDGPGDSTPFCSVGILTT